MAEACLAQFSDAERLVSALERLRERGYRELDAWAPHPIEGLDKALGLRRSRVPRYTLGGGVFGALLAYGGQWWMNAYNYPLNVGGRPAHSAPAFIPITFELTVLCAALATVFGLFVEARLGALWRWVDEVPGFDTSSIDRFWLAISGSDPELTRDTEPLLKELGAEQVTWVEAAP
jgi:hypothetical protein